MNHTLEGLRIILVTGCAFALIPMWETDAFVKLGGG